MMIMFPRNSQSLAFLARESSTATFKSGSLIPDVGAGMVWVLTWEVQVGRVRTSRVPVDLAAADGNKSVAVLLGLVPSATAQVRSARLFQVRRGKDEPELLQWSGKGQRSTESAKKQPNVTELSTVTSNYSWCR
eukprot:1484558-Rhodomonas_salina.1